MGRQKIIKNKAVRKKPGMVGDPASILRFNRRRYAAARTVRHDVKAALGHMAHEVPEPKRQVFPKPLPKRPNT